MFGFKANEIENSVAKSIVVAHYNILKKALIFGLFDDEENNKTKKTRAK